MLINEAIKTVMKESKFTQKRMADLLGLNSAQQVGSSLSVTNWTFNKAVKYLDMLGYKVVIKPKSKRELDDEIIITGE